ncbi:dicarboxylate/amino acid:cation symporter [Sphingobacterium sp. DR205]|uniref:dicarboxylate/amino acid:cation symporter n=1 Tax=Sphingobacterium sp. DR205 TaxID=2713573 RepID=UPI0013E50D40|nr:dicarboxylate/amino acid:cation symporter [Sphingobacterium sp. DR205]QIH36285.1 dicarboxylate/amino acid:cation symporter [Sphingobacterium sp. DR205]
MAYSAKTFIQNYGSILLLLLGISIGSLIGIFFPHFVNNLKPIGDIFLNLLFVSVIPLVFFAIASSVANIEGDSVLGRIIGMMSLVFVVGIVVAGVSSVIFLYLFPVSSDLPVEQAKDVIDTATQDSWGEKMVRFLTVSEFSSLLSRQNMLAFVIFSFLVGIATRRSGDSADMFRKFINSGNAVMGNLLVMVMNLAPIGLGAYFAYQVGTLGPQLFGFYAKPIGLYYIFGLLYFFTIFSLFAFLAFGLKGVKRYWQNNILPSLTALSSCSSLATMPANLLAAKQIGVPDTVASVVIPLGTTLHKHGSAIACIFKIYIALLLSGQDFFEPTNLVMAVGITLLVSIVAGGIPNGGYIGEMLIISVYQMPTEVIPSIMIIATLVDPLATMLNATGDSVAAMLTTRLIGQKLSDPITETTVNNG